MHLTAFLVMAAYSLSATAESWLCIPDESTGFNYDKASKSWVHARFKPDEKYVVKPAKEDAYKWEVVEMSKQIVMFRCVDDFATLGDLLCEDLGNFRFNKLTLKFAIGMTYGYLGQIEKHPDMTPDSVFVTIGRCAAL